MSVKSIYIIGVVENVMQCICWKGIHINEIYSSPA